VENNSTHLVAHVNGLHVALGFQVVERQLETDCSACVAAMPPRGFIVVRGVAIRLLTLHDGTQHLLGLQKDGLGRVGVRCTPQG
jgi:hypothetical protein